jgi:hypothetical protein
VLGCGLSVAYCPARAKPRRAVASEFDLLGEGEGVLDLDAEILDGALRA